MKPVHTWADLTQFGINALTGEACAYSMRVLCDVNEDGADLLAEYLGLCSTIAFAGTWNTEVDGKPGIGSVMLDRDSLLRLAQFAFFRAGALAIYKTVGSLTPVETPERLAQYEALERDIAPEDCAIIRNPTIGADQPHVGSRNVHAFTGRVE